jgi:peptidoglycan hydrolase CwlO-like protein
MRPQPSLLLVSLMLLAATLIGCTDESVELKQKIAELEKKIEKQQKDFGEFVGRFAPPKDFSADIQRIEDQQDRISQILKTQVEPINSRLEEFRDWAQEAQKEREDVRQGDQDSRNICG